MTIVVDGVNPDPIRIPRGGQIAITVAAHGDPSDVPGVIRVMHQPAVGPATVLAEFPATLDAPHDPVPWGEVSLLPIALPGVSHQNLGGGLYLLQHTQ